MRGAARPAPARTTSSAEDTRKTCSTASSHRASTDNCFARTRVGGPQKGGPGPWRSRASIITAARDPSAKIGEIQQGAHHTSQKKKKSGVHVSWHAVRWKWPLLFSPLSPHRRRSAVRLVICHEEPKCFHNTTKLYLAADQVRLCWPRTHACC